MKTIIPKSWQITGFLDGSITKIIVPMKVQPIFSEDGYVYEGNYKDRYKNDMNHEDWTIQFCKDFAPYTLNHPLIVRETWFYCDNSEFQSPSYWCYKADSNASAPANWDNIPRDERPEWARWNSPITMPKDAARMTLTPVGVRAVRVKDITEDELKAIGCRMHALLWDDGEEWLKSKYGQSAWEQNEWVFIYDVKTQKI